MRGVSTISKLVRWTGSRRNLCALQTWSAGRGDAPDQDVHRYDVLDLAERQANVFPAFRTSHRSVSLLQSAVASSINSRLACNLALSGINIVNERGFRRGLHHLDDQFQCVGFRC